MLQQAIGIYRTALIDNSRFFYNECDNSKNFVEKFCPILDTHVSGSPLVQDGKLIGAVTHVLVNDPTMGYGIFIENMLEAAEGGD